MSIINKDLRTRQINADQADIVASMENTQSMFVSMYNAGEITKAATLFAENAVLDLPDTGLTFNGIEEITKGLLLIADKRTERVRQNAFDIHLLHSPSFYVSEDRKSGRGEWDTYSYNISFRDNSFENEVMLTRFDVWFNTAHIPVTIEKMNWHVMQSWKPIDYDNGEVPFINLSLLKEMCGFKPNAKADDYKALQRLTNYFVFTHLRDSEQLFCGEPDDAFSMKTLFSECVEGPAIKEKFKELQLLEQQNNGKYISLMLHANQMFAVDGNCAEGWMLAKTMEIKGAAFGYDCENEILVRNICVLHCTYKRIGSEWKVKSYSLVPVLRLASKKYDKPAFVFDRMTVPGNTFGYEIPQQDSLDGKAADCYCIENIVNAWVNGVRRREVQYFINTYMKESGLPYKFDFKSRGLDAPSVDTPDAIYERTKGFDTDLIPKQPAYHTASTPVIVFSADGTHAKACWIDYGNTNMVLAFGQEAGTGAIPYFASADKYMHSFDKVDGIWYMTHWYFEPMLSVSKHNFISTPGASKGWCGSSNNGYFQAPYEDYSEWHMNQQEDNMTKNNGLQFDFKANYDNFINHRPTSLIPNSFVGNKILGFGAINGPWIEKGNQFGDCYDAFGIKWEYPSTGGGAAIPNNHEKVLLDDICDWREKVHIPNPADYDWKSFYEMDCKMLGEPNREAEYVDFGFGNGVYERLASLMGFEGALIAMATDPDEVNAFFTAVTDYKVAAIDYIIDAYHPDTITYFDDVATERALFMSPDVYRKLVKPHHKRFAQECLKRGIKPIYHCCGKAESIVEDMIDCGWVAWTSVQPSNDICTLIEKYSDRIGFIGGYDTTGIAARPDSTPQIVGEEVARCLKTYGKYHKGYCFFGFRYANSLDPAIQGESMGMVVGACMEQSFAILMSEMENK